MIFRTGAHEVMVKVVMETQEKVIIAIVHLKAIVVPANMKVFLKKSIIIYKQGKLKNMYYDQYGFDCLGNYVDGEGIQY